MFIMTSDIQAGKYRVKPSAVKWRSSVLNIVETCTIVLPRSTCMRYTLTPTDDNIADKDSDSKKNKLPENKLVFNEGDKVRVSLGYDGKNKPRFAGFIRRINQTERLELECEGYSYQLPDVFSKSYASTTIRDILADLTRGTDIKIADKTADVKVTNVRFKNASGLQVLEWMKKELYLAVYFDFDSIYVGTFYGWQKGTVKLRLGWNTVGDKDFKKRKTYNNVLIQLVAKDSKGSIKKIKSDEKRYSQIKEVKIKAGLDSEIMKQIANYLQSRENYKGYEGSITCFLEPVLQKSSVADITDNRFPERAGLFFVETVEGSFDSNGGRQKVTLNYFGYGNGG
jgi:hypothetical protein